MVVFNTLFNNFLILEIFLAKLNNQARIWGRILVVSILFFNRVYGCNYNKYYNKNSQNKQSL